MFAPDAQTLFVNIQVPGTTSAIRGPFGGLDVTPVVPEVPVAALLPLAAAGVVGAAVALRRRGKDSAPDPA